MKATGLAILLWAALAVPVVASPPASSLRPVARPALPADPAAEPAFPVIVLRPLPRPVSVPGPAPTTIVTESTAGPTIRPRPRPAAAFVAAPPAAAAPTAAAPAILRVGLISVPRPMPRPAFQRQADTPEEVQTVAAVRILPGRSAVVGRKGSVCGDPAIQGEVLAPITSRVRGCGIDAPVRVTSVDGVALSTGAVLDCETARALRAWVSGGLKPAFGRKEVARLQVAASYACRPRNNVKGAKVSEHGRGKAIDIAAIELANGTTISVLDHWRRSAGKPMRRAYQTACGTFGTTLGPDADRFHRNHIHLDTARHGNGAYCR